MAVTSQKHFLVRHYFPGSYGDRPEPWQVEFTCGGCGAELWSAEEGYGSSPGTAEDAFEEHLAALEADDEQEG